MEFLRQPGVLAPTHLTATATDEPTVNMPAPIKPEVIVIAPLGEFDSTPEAASGSKVAINTADVTASNLIKLEPAMTAIDEPAPLLQPLNVNAAAKNGKFMSNFNCMFVSVISNR